MSTQTDMNLVELEELVVFLNKVLNIEKLKQTKFSLSNIKDINSKITLYTGFPSYLTKKAFYGFLGPAADNLKYCKKQEDPYLQSGEENKHFVRNVCYNSKSSS